MIAWIYYAVVQLAAFALFWLPPWAWTFGGWREPIPLGLALAVALCLARAWTAGAGAPTIKPLPQRPTIDAWSRPVELLLGWLIGQPEDGPSGRFAYGPSWVGAYNAGGSTWRAIRWQCRNWFNGLNYRTWFGDPARAPNYSKPYTVPRWIPFAGGSTRTPHLGWQSLPATDGWVGPFKLRMVFSI